MAGAIAHLWRDMIGNRNALSQSDTTANDIIENIWVIVADNVWLCVDPKFIDLAAKLYKLTPLVKDRIDCKDSITQTF